jgi:hypothetical protein
MQQNQCRQGFQALWLIYLRYSNCFVFCTGIVLKYFLLKIYMSMALRNTSKDSLIIIDEFGKGTAEADGLALLAASVEDFLKRESRSPTIFFTTHFYSLLNYISPSPVLKTQVSGYLLYYYHLVIYNNEIGFI